MNEEAGSQCKRCMHGKRNSGRLVPRRRAAYFCMKAEALADQEVAALIGPVMTALAEEGRCPHASSGEGFRDAYRSLDSGE